MVSILSNILIFTRSPLSGLENSDFCLMDLVVSIIMVSFISIILLSVNKSSRSSAIIALDFSECFESRTIILTIIHALFLIIPNCHVDSEFKFESVLILLLRFEASVLISLLRFEDSR